MCSNRYLYLYERVFIHGDDPDHPDDEDSGPRGSKNSRILVHQVPVKYNYRQHNVHYRDRPPAGLSTRLAIPNQYERLEKSLLSGKTMVSSSISSPYRLKFLARAIFVACLTTDFSFLFHVFLGNRLILMFSFVE